MAILVTGARGMLRQNLCPILEDAGYEVIETDREELEITDLNRIYLNKGLLNVDLIGRGFAWLDTGTSRSLIQAGQFVQTIEDNQGIKIACLEEVALRMGFLDAESIQESAMKYKNNEYYSYVKGLE